MQVPEARWKAALRAFEVAQKKQAAFVAHLCQLCPEVKTAQELALRFVEMVRQRRPADLDGWLEAAKNSPIAELKNLALTHFW